jgi:replicative DNA helicase
MSDIEKAVGFAKNVSKRWTADEKEAILSILLDEVQPREQEEINLISFGELYEEAKIIADKGNAFSGLSTGYACIDEMTKGLNGGDILVVFAGTHQGKQERCSELIPTPHGDKKFGELTPGDFVFGSDGRPAKVLATWPQGVMDIWRVNFSDGSYLDTGAEHLWTLQCIDRSSRTLSTRELATKIPSDGYHIPLTKPLEYDDDTEPIPGYELGMYIADGSTQGRQIRITKSAGAVSDYLLGIDNELTRYDHPSTCGYFYANRSSKISQYIIEVGLGAVKSAGKFIPNEWFSKSVRARTELLTGLLDGDGSFIPRHRQVVYHTTSSKLADDVVRLVTSLGSIARKCVVRSRTGDYFAVRISGLQSNPFRLSKGRDSWQPAGKNSRKHRFVQSVEIVGQEEAMCISVESVDQLYVGDTRFNIVTHNSALTQNIAVNVAKQGKVVLFIGLEMTNKQNSARFIRMGADDAMLPFIFPDKPDIDYRDIKKFIEKAKSDNVSLVIVDQLQDLIHSTVNEQGEIGQIMAELKRASIANDVPMIVVSHVNRAESDIKAPPTLSALKGSSSIEQKTDMAIALYLDNNAEPGDEEYYKKLHVALRKNRPSGMDGTKRAVLDVGLNVRLIEPDETKHDWQNIYG